MVLEPVLGEGGYIPAPASFLRGRRTTICREHGILFVADEVQTGFARTGTMFAIEQAGVRARRRSSWRRGSRPGSRSRRSARRPS